jgi:transposase
MSAPAKKVQQLSRSEMEARRIDAARLFRDGDSPPFVAELLGVSSVTAYRWLRVYRTGEFKLESLAMRITTGRPSRLTPAHVAQLKRLLEKGRDREGKLWTQMSFTNQIQDLCGIRYNPNHVGRLMKRWGWISRYAGRGKFWPF